MSLCRYKVEKSTENELWVKPYLHFRKTIICALQESMYGLASPIDWCYWKEKAGRRDKAILLHDNVKSHAVKIRRRPRVSNSIFCGHRQMYIWQWSKCRRWVDEFLNKNFYQERMNKFVDMWEKNQLRNKAKKNFLYPKKGCAYNKFVQNLSTIYFHKVLYFGFS